MKKTFLLLLAMASFVTLQAQWTDNAAQNTFLANCSADAGELYTSIDPNSGDIYLQWNCFHSNGWSPTLQRIDYLGNPQWGNDGIHIGGHTFSSMSEGLAMVALRDGVVSCFANYDGFTYAVKINADGTFAWGEQGIQLFGGLGFSRTELVADNDGGFWALGSDYTSSYLQHIEADGTQGPTITVSDNTGYKICYGQLTLGYDGIVFFTYERIGNGFYTDKEIYLAGYAKDGTMVAPPVRLMASQTFQVTYIHRVVSDGNGGGYAYIWHPGIQDAFNTYVFHFDHNGFSTISDDNGSAVHSPDPTNFYYDAYATVDPVSHDLIIAYLQTDTYTQSQSRIFVNRIKPNGDKVWGDGILVADYYGSTYSDLLVDAFEDGNGFSIVFNTGDGYYSSIEAKGFDKNGGEIWDNVISSYSVPRAMCQNSSGFYMNQNVVTWVNSNTGGVFGQNFGTMGELGEIGPTPPPVPCCYEPNNFDGTYYYDVETGEYGAWLTWEAPATGTPDYYKLYVTDPSGCTTTVEVAGDKLEYFDVTTVLGTARYQLTAVSGGNESGFATTSTTGEDYILINVTGIGEHNLGEMTSVLRIFTTTGQCIKHNNVNKLSNGVYILQGLTQDGQPISQKVVVNR